jgi:hypothetical protein
MPQRGGQAILIRNANPADMLRLPDGAPQELDKTFTIEAYFQLESLYPDASVRVIVSQWDGSQQHPGWAFGVTSEKSKHQPRNLIIQLTTESGYEVIPSNFRIELHKAYYAAAAVNLKDPTESGITFYLKDITDMDAPLHTAGVSHKLTGSIASKSPLVIGGRAGAQQGWDGLIDEIRLSTTALKAPQILYNDGDPREAICGHWLLKDPGFFKDSSGHQKDLIHVAERSLADREPIKPPTPTDAPLIDFCHVLFNSNEFLYVD